MHFSDEISAIQRGEFDTRLVVAFKQTNHPVFRYKPDNIVSLLYSSNDAMMEWSGLEEEKTLWTKAEKMVEERRRKLKDR